MLDNLVMETHRNFARTRTPEPAAGVARERVATVADAAHVVVDAVGEVKADPAQSAV